MINVVNKYKEANHIYCGRGTPVGNPFPITPTNDRDTVCDLYAEWFKENVNTPSVQAFLKPIEESISKGKDVNLGCFCSPQRCHCDTIKEYLVTHWIVNDRTDLARELIAEFEILRWKLEEEKLTETCYRCKALRSNWTGVLTHVISIIDNKMRKEEV